MISNPSSPGSKMSKHIRSRAELEEHLREQRAMLRASAQGYDAGNNWEAKRLASVAYTLLHDGNGRTKSLLSQLGLRSGLRFVSTARSIETMKPPVALCLIKLTDKDVSFVPYCEANQIPDWSRWVQCQSWWNEIIFKDAGGRPLTRKNLIFALRAQDGGGHVDGELPDNAYRPFMIDGDPTMRFVLADGTPAPLAGAHLPSMRQIAWEMEETFKSLDKMRPELQK